MHPRNRPALRAIVGTVLIAGSVCSSSATAAAGEPSERLLWRPCEQQSRADCATLRVPVDRARPGGPSIDIAVARHKATNPDKRVGTLVYAPAGPGSSGVDAVTSDAQRKMLFSPEATERFDIVSFDPRGVRRSHPVICDSELTDLATPWNPAEFADRRTDNAALGEDCRQRTGEVFDHLDSNDIARDMDSLRAALGEQKINIYALSYGTVFGQMYAELFPKRIRTMVLDSNVDHSQTTRRAMLSSAHGAQDAFDEFVTWCGRHRECVLHGRDIRRIVGQLRVSSERGELTEPGKPGNTIDPAELISGSTGIVPPMAIPDWQLAGERIAELARIEPRATDAAKQSNANPRNAKHRNNPSSDRHTRTIPLPISIYCADHSYSVNSFGQLRNIRRQMANEAPDLHRGAFGPPMLCMNWPGKPTNPQHRLNVRGAPPIMVINSEHDPSTPHEAAVNVAEQLGNAVLVTYQGSGHGAYLRTRCTTSTVDRYLIDRAIPAADRNCPAGR